MSYIIDGIYKKKFESIDVFIQFLKSKALYERSDEDTCFHATYDYPTIVLDILRSKFNKPSQYDIDIIKGIQSRLVDNDSLLRILEEYKKRKV